MKTILQKFDISAGKFDEIIMAFQSKVEPIDCINNVYRGTKNKNKIYYDADKQEMLCPEYIAEAYVKIKQKKSYDFRQFILRRVDATDDSFVEKTIDGTRAWNYMLKNVILKHYTMKEFDEICQSHAEEYIDLYKQYHFFPTVLDTSVIYKCENVKKYDMNGAHHAMLLKIFPRCKRELMRLYKRRHENPIYKCYVNYFVGMLKKKGYEKTYNYIVHHITWYLIDAINYVGGNLLYANTDGFAVSEATNTLPVSKELGEFKIEYSGTAYYYKDKNYSIFQFGKDKVGCCFTSVRDSINLDRGEVVHYNINRKEINGIIIREPINITKEKLEYGKIY